MGPGNHVLDRGPDPPWEGAVLRGKGASHCKLKGHVAVISAKTAEAIEMPFVLWARIGRRNYVLDGVRDPPWEGAIFVERGVYCKVSAVSCAKGAESIDLPFICGPGWAKGSTSSTVFAIRRQCAHTRGNIGATWRILLNRMYM